MRVLYTELYLNISAFDLWMVALDELRWNRCLRDDRGVTFAA